MCGIAGFAGFNDDRLLRAMCTSLTHRGPDDEGYLFADGAGLAMRRLAIIDLKTGHQPIANESGDVHAVLNGEIYNYQELTRSLQSHGHRFATSSDTETIVHLYEDYGLEFAQHLRGMFAIALWDTKRKRLILVRDRIGEKPLFFAQRGNRLLFGSEIKAILQCGESRIADRQAVCEFLALGYVPAPKTFFEGIAKLEPGHMLVWENGRAKTYPYWVRNSSCSQEISFDNACESLSTLLSQTVQYCLKSDVEVGAFLSGGIDSSVLVALMRSHSAKVQTFCVGYRGRASGFNELGYARRVAQELGTQHHELILEGTSTAELLPKILWHFDEPHGEPTSALVYLLCEFTRKHVKVALGGTGGDEIFFGYPRHGAIRWLEYYHWLPRWAREHVVQRIIRRWPESTRGSRFAKRAKRFVSGASLPPDQAYLSWVSLLDSSTRFSLLNESWASDVMNTSGDSYLRKHLCDDAPGDLPTRAANIDVDGYLPEYQLAYMDRMSMAHGLEVRSPLCDYQLVEAVTSLPTHYRLRGTRGKHIFKQIARQWIPKKIAERKKVGFDSPFGEWAKKDLREFIFQFLSPEHVARTGLLNPTGVRQVLTDHLSGRRDYSLQLWSLIALEAWHRMYIEDGVTDGRAYTLSDLRGAQPSLLTAHHSSLRSSKLGNGHRSPRSPSRVARQLGLTGLRRRAWESSPRVLRRLLVPVVDRIPPRAMLGRQFRDWLAFAQSAQWWTSAETDQYQLEQVRRVCLAARRISPFYRDLFDSVGFQPQEMCSLEQFECIPAIDRSAVDKQFGLTYTKSRWHPGIDRVTTGGTGGMPLRFLINADRSSIEFAHLIASWERCGFRLGMPRAVFRGRVVHPDRRGLRHEYDPILREHYYSTFHMGDDDIRRYLEHIAQIGPCYLHVYPSSVAAIARYLRRVGVKPPNNIHGIIAESENVYPEQRQSVESTFGCRYFSCYGHSEKLVLAAECEHSSDYHVWPTYGYFELLDDRGHRVRAPGQRGEIVGTGFINSVMPFIRYRTGDFATYVGDRCEACGRNHTIIRDVRGHNTQEMLVASDRSLISWTSLNMHDDTFDHVHQFQFSQKTPGYATLRIVPTKEFGPECEVRIQEQLNKRLKDRLQFELELVEEIELTDRGKSIFVDQRIVDQRSVPF